MNDAADGAANLAADRLVAARDGSPLPTGVIDPVDREAAFAIQEATVARLGGHGGWKVGASSPTALPIFAPLPRCGLVLGERVPPSRAPWRALEVEIAYRVGPAAEAEGDPLDVFDAVALAVEVVESRFADFDAAAPLARLADLQSHGALLIGDPVPIARIGFDPARPLARLAIEGRDAIVTLAGNPAGDPAVLLRRLHEHAARRALGLRPGDWVTTGSTTGLVRIPAATAFTAAIDGLGILAGTTPP